MLLLCEGDGFGVCTGLVLSRFLRLFDEGSLEGLSHCYSHLLELVKKAD